MYVWCGRMALPGFWSSGCCFCVCVYLHHCFLSAAVERFEDSWYHWDLWAQTPVTPGKSCVFVCVCMCLMITANWLWSFIVKKLSTGCFFDRSNAIQNLMGSNQTLGFGSCPDYFVFFWFDLWSWLLVLVCVFPATAASCWLVVLISWFILCIQQ